MLEVSLEDERLVYHDGLLAFEGPFFAGDDEIRVSVVQEKSLQSLGTTFVRLGEPLACDYFEDAVDNQGPDGHIFGSCKSNCFFRV